MRRRPPLRHRIALYGTLAACILRTRGYTVADLLADKLNRLSDRIYP